MNLTADPNPEQTPQEVVRIQMKAMQHNDDPSPNAGIALAFKFASPQNRQKTGPLEKFIRMVKSPDYAVMLNHKSAEYGQVHLDSGEAQQLVRVTAANGEVALYVFILHKQADGPYKDCWMTDGVVRLRPEDVVPAPPKPGTNGDGHERV